MIFEFFKAILLPQRVLIGHTFGIGPPQNSFFCLRRQIRSMILRWHSSRRDAGPIRGPEIQCGSSASAKRPQVLF